MTDFKKAFLYDCFDLLMSALGYMCDIQACEKAGIPQGYKKGIVSRDIRKINKLIDKVHTELESFNEGQDARLAAWNWMKQWDAEIGAMAEGTPHLQTIQLALLGDCK